MRRKYPRTTHFSFSPGATPDDVIASNVNDYLRDKIVIVTEKMDGENTTMYHDYLHARSPQFTPHPSRDWVRRFWAEKIQHQIPENMRICGENLYAQHSICYTSLKSYFMAFSIWIDDVSLSWKETTEWCQMLDLTLVPVISEGLYNENAIRTIAENVVAKGGEGIVVRLADSFSIDDFSTSVFKYVRANHVQTDQHWMHKAVIPNQLTVD